MKEPRALLKLPGDGPVDAQDVADTIVKNYGLHRLTVEQLKSLQGWVREQEKAHAVKR